MLSDIFDSSESAPSPHLVPRERLADGTVRLLVHARPAEVTLEGQPAQVLTYNGTLPGPLLVLQEGERAQVVFTNHLPEPTSLHLHGLHIPPEVDAPHREVPPGASATYTFDVPRGAAGTYWYHPHVHGTMTRQLFEGLAGPLVVRGAEDREEPLAGAQEHVLVLQDLSLQRGRPAPHTELEWGRGKGGGLRLVNGQVHPVLPVRTGLLRLRLINASAARDHRLTLPGRPLHLIGLDGGLLETPVAREELLLVPGERADVLVEAREAGTLTLLDLPTDAPARPTALLTLVVEGPSVQTQLPAALRPMEARDGEERAPRR